MTQEVNNKFYDLEHSYNNSTEEEAMEKAKLLRKNGFTVFGIRRSNDHKERWTVTYAKEIEE